MYMRYRYPAAKHRFAILTITLMSVGAFLLLRHSGTGRVALIGESPFAQACRKMVTREDFVAMCPNAAAMDEFRVVTLVDVTESASRCGILASAKDVIGMTMFVYVFNDEAIARARVELEVDSSTQQRGNILGFNELSILNYQFGTTPLLYVSRGRSYIDLTDPNPALCTPEERIGIGKLLYERTPMLENILVEK